MAPTDETIAGGTYPFSRSLYIYVSKAAAADNPAVVSYVDLYLSPEGLMQPTMLERLSQLPLALVARLA